MKGAYALPGQHRLVVAIALVYVGAWLGYAGQIEIGYYLIPEDQTVLELAVDGVKSPAPTQATHTVYGLLLSLIARLFETTEATLLGMRFFNGACLAASAGFCAAASAFIWRKNAAIWISGLLVALNPVLVFWSLDLKPALPAFACLSFACWKILHWMRHPSTLSAVLISLALCLAASMVTPLVATAALWPLIALLYPRKKHALSNAIASVATTGAFAATFLVSGYQLQAPIEFNLSSLPENLYSFLGSYEPEDSKSYALFQRIHYFLLLNPIYFGTFLLLATAGVYARFKNGHKGRSIIVLGSLLGSFILVYLLQSPTGSIRLAALPFLAIFAGGTASIPHIWRFAGRKTKSQILSVGTLIILISGSSFFLLKDPNRFLDDSQYLARANLHINQNENSRIWARKALEIDPDLSEMQSVLIRSTFNDWAALAEWRPISIEEAESLLAAITTSGCKEPEVQIIQGIYHWKLRDAEAATRLWEPYSAQSGFARLCLYWTNQTEKPSSHDLPENANSPYDELFFSSLSVNRSAPVYSALERKLDNIFTYAH